MKKILAIITLLLFFLLLWCTKDKYKECCEGNSTNNKVVKKVPEIKVKKDGPLVYKWNSGEAITNDLWNSKREEILSGKMDGKVLQISGPYFKEEGPEIGITRAKAAFAKLGIPDFEKVEFGSKLIKFHEGAKTEHFSGTGFNWLIRNKNIQQIDSKTLIYFPTNSTKKISNANIINYLKDVAKSLQGNNKKIFLSGHSDSRGNAVKNKKLALGRSNSIKNELVRLGVPANRISAISYGEEKPIADNKTKIGQQKNRRVELEIK